MRVNLFRFIPFLIIILLIGILIGRATVQAEEIETIKYIIMDQEEYEETYPEESEENEIMEEIQSSKISLGTFNISAYCPCEKCCGKKPSDPLYGITCSGDRATEGLTIAADLSNLPLGTKVSIEGVGERTVEDKGGAIKGNRLDLYFSDHQAALNFGRQQLEVWEVE